jgi:hypothetical protein
MSVAIEKLYIGQTLHDYHMYTMGNTTMRKEGHWTANVLEVDLENRKALISWNSNPPKWLYESQLKKFRTKEKIPRKVTP